MLCDARLRNDRFAALNPKPNDICGNQIEARGRRTEALFAALYRVAQGVWRLRCIRSNSLQQSRVGLRGSWHKSVSAASFRLELLSNEDRILSTRAN
jgi:hypothetical protein